MTPSLLFRLCITLSVALGLISIGIDLIFTDFISTEVANAVAKDLNYGLLEKHPFIFFAVLAPWLVTAFAGVIGAFLFKRWGRLLCLYSTVIGLLIYPFFGPTVLSGISYALDQASTTLWGAALALAYFSPISARFKVENANQRSCLRTG